jgi:hypothetical protein
MQVASAGGKVVVVVVVVVVELLAATEEEEGDDGAAMVVVIVVVGVVALLENNGDGVIGVVVVVVAGTAVPDAGMTGIVVGVVTKDDVGVVPFEFTNVVGTGGGGGGPAMTTTAGAAVVFHVVGCPHDKGTILLLFMVGTVGTGAVTATTGLGVDASVDSCSTTMPSLPGMARPAKAHMAVVSRGMVHTVSPLHTSNLRNAKLDT